MRSRPGFRNLGANWQNYSSQIASRVWSLRLAGATRSAREKRSAGCDGTSTMYIPDHFIAEWRDARNYGILDSRGWWMNPWPFWGWVETFTKVAAWLFVLRIRSPGVKASHTSVLTWMQAGPAYKAEVAVMFVACFFLLLAILDRLLLYREVISMAFVFPNNLAHWSVLYTMLHGPELLSTRHYRAFLWLMLLGDVSKLIFFKVHDFNIKALAKHALYLLVTLYAIAYAVILTLDYHTGASLSMARKAR
ncbi:hypothetical protein FVE85_1314 [Porphyridium purpureum]|uniref:Uncharacterized protein n=1 Tax=Porphyridium purpureum TaxID=35688 RepID=A0A5J4YK48_PORPP|nr:hypothetical protein FVE85_1314 [Porphyridium purpureum]|eukprot:POR9398..scf251_18